MAKNIRTLKALVNASVLESVELLSCSVQAYNLVEGEEYCNIVAYIKDRGRYYYIDREGRRFLASHYDRVEWLAGELLEALENEKSAVSNAADQLENSGSVLVCSELLPLFFVECDRRGIKATSAGAGVDDLGRMLTRYELKTQADRNQATADRFGVALEVVECLRDIETLTEEEAAAKYTAEQLAAAEELGAREESDDNNNNDNNNESDNNDAQSDNESNEGKQTAAVPSRIAQEVAKAIENMKAYAAHVKPYICAGLTWCLSLVLYALIIISTSLAMPLLVVFLAYNMYVNPNYATCFENCVILSFFAAITCAGFWVCYTLIREGGLYKSYKDVLFWNYGIEF